MAGWRSWSRVEYATTEVALPITVELAMVDWSAVGATAEWVGALALWVSGLFIAKQAYELVSQSRAANRRAAFEAAQAATHDIDAVLAVLVERPELRPYFFDNVATADEAERRARVLTLGIWMLDALAGGVHAEEFDNENSSHPMKTYAEEMLKASPVMRDLLDEHPHWWGRLQRLSEPDNPAEKKPAPEASEAPASQEPPAPGAA